MSARINYNRITGSNIQGDATTVTEPLGTLVVTNNGELRLHDGNTSGGVALSSGGAPTSNLVNGSYTVSLGSDGALTLSDAGKITSSNGLELDTNLGNITLGAALGGPGLNSHFHIAFFQSNSSPPAGDLFLGDDFNYVKLPGGNGDLYETYGVDIGTNSRSGLQYVWRFGTDGSLTFPGNTVQTTAYTGVVLPVSQSVPTSSSGKIGDRAGMVAYTDAFFYYCTADFAGTQYPAQTQVGDGNGVSSGYLIPNSYQLPSVGWIIYYNNQTAVINQVNNGGNPGYYTVFTDTELFIPANATIQYGPATTAQIWQRIAKDATSW
jgi:hypothetical protein